MKIEALTGGIKEVEHGIRPPMYSAVTLPIRVNDKEIGLVVYVSVSNFASVYMSDDVLQEYATEIARRINKEK